jgi:CelD/BcsL family acetyltransferase involved in cellulose biosynthesis
MAGPVTALKRLSLPSFAVVEPAAPRFAASVVADVVAIAEEWRALERGGHATMFQRFDWLAPWYAAAARDGRATPEIVAVRRGASGPLVMLLPLARRRERGVDLVEFADLGLTDYCAPVLAPLDVLNERDAGEALAAALGAITCDLFRATKLVPTVGGRRNPFLDLPGLEVSPLAAHGLDLERDFPAQAARVFDRDFHKDLQRILRKIEKEKGKPRLIVAETEAQARGLFDLMVEMRRARFGALGRTCVFTDAVWHDFYRDVFARAGTGHLVAALEAGGEIVAVDLMVEYNDALHVLAGAFQMDEGWRKYSLGNVLTYLEMAWAAERGLGVFDLTIGAEAYKFRFGVRALPLHDYERVGRARGLVAHARFKAKAELRRRPKLEAILRRVLGRGPRPQS